MSTFEDFEDIVNFCDKTDHKAQDLALDRFFYELQVIEPKSTELLFQEMIKDRSYVIHDRMAIEKLRKFHVDYLYFMYSTALFGRESKSYVDIVSRFMSDSSSIFDEMLCSACKDNGLDILSMNPSLEKEFQDGMRNTRFSKVRIDACMSSGDIKDSTRLLLFLFCKTPSGPDNRQIIRKYWEDSDKNVWDRSGLGSFMDWSWPSLLSGHLYPGSKIYQKFYERMSDLSPEGKSEWVTYIYKTYLH